MRETIGASFKGIRSTPCVLPLTNSEVNPENPLVVRMPATFMESLITATAPSKGSAKRRKIRRVGQLCIERVGLCERASGIQKREGVVDRFESVNSRQIGFDQRSRCIGMVQQIGFDLRRRQFNNVDIGIGRA